MKASPSAFKDTSEQRRKRRGRGRAGNDGEILAERIERGEDGGESVEGAKRK